MIIKNKLFSVLPPEVLNLARYIQGCLKLRRQASLSFDSSRLRPVSSAFLQSILDDASLSKDWEVDQRTIISLFADEDKMGGVNPGDRRALYYLVRSLKPRRVLEVGTHIGASTLHIASALKRLEDSGRIDSVDICDVNDMQAGPWKAAGLHAPPLKLAETLGCQDMVEFVTGASLDFMAGCHGRRYDLIFLDGDHTAAAVYKEVSAALPLLNEGGVVLLHDFYPDGKPLFPDGNIIFGPAMALARIERENTSIKALPFDTLPWPTKQGSRKTSLALVTTVP